MKQSNETGTTTFCKATKLVAFLLLVLASLCSASPASSGVSSPAEVRRRAFAAKAICIKEITSEPGFKTGQCGTSGCMNAYLACASSGESVVAESAQKAVANVRSSDVECVSSVESLLAVAANELPRESEIVVVAPLDTSQAVGIARRLAAYELIYLTLKDQSCHWSPNSKRRMPLAP